MISTLLNEQGRTEGFREGRREGFLEGVAKGKIEEGRDWLIVLLSKRLGPMPPEIDGSIRALDDLDRIHSILTRFMEINDWRELEQLLNGKK
jgi:hypothetical protein